MTPRLVPIQLDKPRTLRLTLGAYRRVLEQIGVDLFDPEQVGNLELKNLGVLITEMLRHRDGAQPELSLADVEDLIDVGNVHQALTAVYMAIGVSVPAPPAEKEGEERPPFVPPRRTRSWFRIFGRSPGSSWG